MCDFMESWDDLVGDVMADDPPNEKATIEETNGTDGTRISITLTLTVMKTMLVIVIE